MSCGKKLQTGFCGMDEGHRGRHSTVVFYCDSCGKMRRGHPEGRALDSNGDVDVEFCWFCINVLGPAEEMVWFNRKRTDVLF